MCGANWTGLFTPGETVRLRIVNASAMTNFQSPIRVQTVGYMDRKSQSMTWRTSRRMRTSERPPK
ncbi:MAG: hypothetical protein B7Y98_04740 [Sphingomonas sp. 32-62-10]|nr:MAG: hypothetical protein B7Y98_04740 [Sphingomonas sp. 32-62-10]